MNKNSHLACAFFLSLFLSTFNLAAFPIKQDTIFPQATFIHYGEEQGLTSKTIYFIIQDHEGFIWMSSDAGVFRFDGKKFKHFTTKDGITDNEVLIIYEDRQQRIWFLTFNGYLSFWKDGKFYNPGNTPFLKDAYTGGTFSSVFEDQQNNLWMGTEPFKFFMIKNDTVQKVDLPKTISRHFYQDESGTLWSMRNTSLFKVFDAASKDTIPLPMKLVNPKVCNRNNLSEMFFTSGEGIFRVYDRKVSLYIDKNNMPKDDDITTMTMFGDTILLCSMERGCFMYKNGVLVNHCLNDKKVTRAIKDREGNIWFSTFRNGVFMEPGGNPVVANINHSSGLSGEAVLSIARGQNNTVWLGYDNGTVDCISGNLKKSYILNNVYGASNFRVTSLLVDGENTWCGTDIGIFLIHHESVVWSAYRIAVKRLFKGSDNSIYFTTSNNLGKIQKGENRFSLDLVFSDLIRTFSGIEYKTNHFLISSTNGLLEYIPGKKPVKYKTETDFSRMRILDMKQDKEGMVLLATTQGLYTMKNGRILQHISESEGLSDNNCNKVYIEGNFVFAATGNGLSILEKKGEHLELSEIKTIRNGLLSNIVNDVTVSDRNIYVATDQGVSIVRHSDVAPDVYARKVRITEVTTDTTFVIQGDNYSFKAGIPRLIIRFAYPVFNPANQARIKYRLLQNEADDPQWDYSISQEVEFLSLNPGNYIFQLKPDLKKEDTNYITSFHFYIKPFWWQTIAAKILFVILGGGLIAFVIWRITKMRYELRMRELKQQNLLEGERNRIASDIHDDIGADLTKINMLAARMHVTDEKNREIATKITVKSNQVLERMDHIVWTLNSDNKELHDLFYFVRDQTANVLEDTDISLSFETSGDISSFKIDSIKRRNISLVIKELVHNTVKHSGATQVHITIHVQGSLLKITYRDNGKGYILSSVEKGFGHTTLKKRMEEINSSFEMSSGEGSGVQALMMIPIK